MMLGLVLASVLAYGVHLLYTALAMGWSGLGPGPGTSARSGPTGAPPWPRRILAGVGLADTPVGELAAAVVLLGLAGTLAGYGIFGGLVAPPALGVGLGVVPVASARLRLEQRRAAAQEAWPRMIEEIRVLTASLGRSVPQALFEVGLRSPCELRPAFEQAHREWVVSTDFGRTVSLLKHRLQDATADAALETLLVAHELGGGSLDRRLAALAADRLTDVLTRKEARARQSGVRFARRFVVLVPAGMALVGMQIGSGRDAYQTSSGQLAVAAALGIVGLCWWWAGRILRIPPPQRVFAGSAPAGVP